MQHRHRAGARQQGADPQAFVRLVRTEHRERVAMLGTHQGTDFGIRQHAGFSKRRHREGTRFQPVAANPSPCVPLGIPK